MKQQSGRAYRITTVDGKLSVVHSKTGRLVFHLMERDVKIDLGFDGVASCVATFVCVEDEGE